MALRFLFLLCFPDVIKKKTATKYAIGGLRSVSEKHGAVVWMIVLNHRVARSTQHCLASEPMLPIVLPLVVAFVLSIGILTASATKFMKHPTRMKRSKAAILGRETVEILERGSYIVDGVEVDLNEAIDRSMEETCSYPPGSRVLREKLEQYQTVYEVLNESTLSAARKLIQSGFNTAILNFASAKSPGGGFLSGALAQEESLARSSGLYACLVDDEMYPFHRARHDPMYTNYAIYSPGVPIIRDDEGNLLPEPYLSAFITSPAVNAKAVLKKNTSKHGQIRNEMEKRIQKVLGIAAEWNHDGLILGAWGCGAFGNDGNIIAELFYNALTQQFKGAFSRVVFAVIDWSEERRFIGPFRQRFGSL